MDDFYQWAGILAGILSIAGYVPYIIGILQGTTRPNRATWLIWALVGGLLAFSYMQSGDAHSIWLPLGYFVGPFVTMILAFRYGYVAWSRLDTVCVVAALLSLIPWIFSHNPLMTLMINVVIDATGAIPTLIKTYQEPETEDFWAWLIFFAANTIELFAIETWNLASVYPVYLFFLAGFITLFTFLDKVKKRKHAHPGRNN